MKYKTTLYRSVNDNKRYYKISIHPTLFGDYLLDREYGSIKNKKPTGRKSEYFVLLDTAIMQFKALFLQKVKKGYKAKANSNS